MKLLSGLLLISTTLLAFTDAWYDHYQVRHVKVKGKWVVKTLKKPWTDKKIPARCQKLNCSQYKLNTKVATEDIIGNDKYLTFDFANGCFYDIHKVVAKDNPKNGKKKGQKGTLYRHIQCNEQGNVEEFTRDQWWAIQKKKKEDWLQKVCKQNDDMPEHKKCDKKCLGIRKKCDDWRKAEKAKKGSKAFFPIQKRRFSMTNYRKFCPMLKPECVKMPNGKEKHACFAEHKKWCVKRTKEFCWHWKNLCNKGKYQEKSKKWSPKMLNNLKVFQKQANCKVEVGLWCKKQ